MIGEELADYIDTICDKPSNVIIKAFDKKYRLHKQVLNRSCYFEALLDPKWDKSESHEIFFDADEFFTKDAFDMAIRTLYNIEYSIIDSENFEMAIRVLYNTEYPFIKYPIIDSENWKGYAAISNFLGLQGNLEQRMDYLTNFLDENNLAYISNFVYGNEYGDFGSKIEAMCKHYLCKYGYEMAASVWFAIPRSWLKEVLDSDEFYVPTECDRCQFIIHLYKSVPKDDPSQLDVIQDTLNEAIRFCHLTDFQLTSLESITDVYDKPLVHEDKLYRACWLKTRLKELVTGNQTKVRIGHNR
jgi:hypothetical protein